MHIEILVRLKRLQSVLVRNTAEDNIDVNRNFGLESWIFNHLLVGLIQGQESLSKIMSSIPSDKIHLTEHYKYRKTLQYINEAVR